MMPASRLKPLVAPPAVAVIGASRVSRSVTDFPEMTEIDINSPLVRPKGASTVALDARITLGRIDE